MTPVLQENGEILFFAPDSKTPVMVMPAPFMVDGAENYNFQVSVELERNSDGTYTLTYQLPVQWLAEEDRRWPVILDPVVRVVAQY